MKHFYLLLLGTLFCLNWVEAQQTHFSQFYNTSVYLNPALAGIEEESKLTLNYRNHWPQIQNSFVTQNVSFETNLSRYNNGLAINAYRDQAGDAMLTLTSYSGVYAHEIKITKDLYLRAGLKAGLVQKNVAWDKLIFEDMIDSREGVIHNSQQKFGEAISYLDVSTGAFLFTKNFYGGFAINHLNRAEAGLIQQNGKSKLERSYVLHAGANLVSKANMNYSISPNIILSKQGTFTKMNLGIHAQASSLICGLWYASNEAIVLMVGVRGERFQIGYSYDMYPTTMTGSSMGSHEISYAQSFKKRKKRKNKYRKTLCPKF